MRNIEAQDLTFTTWYHWEDRDQIPNSNYPGIYLIAITTGKIEKCQPKWGEVSYVGMTNSKGGLKSRWRGFNRSIHNGKEGHSGGRTVHKALGDYTTWTSSLFVASMSVMCDTTNPTSKDYIKMGLVAFYEYEAFAMFYDQVGGHPKYNKR